MKNTSIDGGVTVVNTEMNIVKDQISKMENKNISFYFENWEETRDKRMKGMNKTVSEIEREINQVKNEYIRVDERVFRISSKFKELEDRLIITRRK